MNTHHLHYFITLAELEHYTKASDQLGVSQPNLSHAIHSIENELQVKLFQKKGRNISLTKYGYLFLDYAKNCVQSLDAGKRKIQAMAGENSGSINLAYIYTLGSSLAPKLVRNFLTQNSNYDVSFQFSVGNSTDIIKGLQSELYDVAFCSKERLRDDIIFVPFIREKLVVVLPQNHPLGEKKKLCLHDLKEEPLITFTKSSGLRPTIEELYQSANIVPDIAYEIGEDSSIAGLVSEGFGFAIMPEIPMLNSFPVTIRQLEEENYQRFIYLAYMKEKYHSPVTNQFIDFIQSMSIEK
ncbi:DNA-binding transcriptional LysR family regulator [Aequitasia blattaphilus]|uniref:LysR family transcriptional regulator n=1 Tax=Aequitasia blattaphilus TaxID=2949332 RepID=A0ABT1E5I3_9FIRM|nr:LysR family transcriptional regulator [Aequitasia blattaphilus]MCP1100839.1 LysR family transcriptional regulator [Aequitasia blattaphilus]MCR8613479.1 LysR family transcriptional regulator [Aequitasia blattaphilus]